MNVTLLLLIKGLLAGVIVGFVTSSIKSWVDRIFMVIMLVSIVNLPIQDAIVINLIVLGLSALMLALRQWPALNSVREDWPRLIIPAIVGGVLGRLLALKTGAPVLLLVLGIYAILVGLRLVLIKPMPEREGKAHSNWLIPVEFLAGGLTGFLSAGGKPFKVPAYNWILGHHPQRAYAMASVGVSVAAWSALTTQIAVGLPLSAGNLAFAVYEFIIVTLVALGIEKVWSPRLNKIVTWAIAPILLFVGIRFILLGIA
ncbi:MAG: hypothetical protein BGO78_16925 [Chloroflexi bacterium 44-23]|nr:MAG: hypothetical protein BGO78_16925 [Chloroflexi bacterium 44-23]